MSAVEASPNLRDFLRIRDEESGSASRRRDLADLFFNTVIATEKRPTPLHSPTASPQASRTLLDIISAEESNSGPRKITVAPSSKDRKSWKSFKDKLRLKRPGGAWASNVETISSDSPAHKTCRSPAARHDVAQFHSTINVMSDESTRSLTQSQNSTDTRTQDEASSSNQVCDSSSPTSRPSPARRSSTRLGSLVPISIEPARSIHSPEQSLRDRISRQNSTQQSSARHSESSRSLTQTMSSLDPREMQHNSGQPCPVHQAEEPPRTSMRRLSAALAEERQLSAREAAAAREAIAVAPALPATEEQPVRMSLMDLLEETDRQMGLGLGGITYDTVGNGEEEDEVGGTGSRASVEQSCCICMVRHKGAAFIPCGHTFCRLCSRELWVSRGNCPLCNNYIVEILDIF